MNFLKTVFALTILAPTILSASPARPGIYKTITLSDGSEVKAELCGDEYLKYWRTGDNRYFVFDAEQNCYILADMELLEMQALTMREKNPLPGYEPNTRIDLGATHEPLIGQKKGLIILVEFTDKKFKEGHDVELYSHIVNDTRYTNEELGFVGSVHDYFYDQSFGQFDLTFDVVGPISLQHNMAYYGGNNYAGYDKNPEAMAKEAIKGAFEILQDFKPYDWFDNNEVDQFFVVYAGRGESDGGSADTIWPHQSSIYLPNKFGGIKVSNYACASELMNEKDIDGIGTFCHEFSHCLGLPDVYDVCGYCSKITTMDWWDVMDSGCYAGNGGFIPVPYNSYQKNYAGWLEEVELEAGNEYTILPISDVSGGAMHVMHNPDNSNEFIFFQSIDNKGWCKGLNAQKGGILAIYINFSKSAWKNNSVNCKQTKPRYTYLPADGNYSTATWEKVYQDLYGYKDKNTSFSSKWRNGGGCDLNLEDITVNADGSVSFNVVSNPNTISSLNLDSTNSTQIYNLDGTPLKDIPSTGLFLIKDATGKTKVMTSKK